MSRRMLIDGTHTEEVRVVTIGGNRLEEYDIESSTKSQLKGNIYLAKVTRVEPSLQAAFVDFGGNRHGFLAFNEIHPDYYQIPIEDREALLRDVAEYEESAAAAQAHLAEIDGELPEDEDEDDDEGDGEHDAAPDDVTDEEASDPPSESDFDEVDGPEPDGDDGPEAASADEEHADGDGEDGSAEDADDEDGADGADGERKVKRSGRGKGGRRRGQRPDRRNHPMRRYKIQEVIKRRQILLVQVVKEERGNKGAALTTYLSLAGRYCVLMPNTSRSGGGVSRKITSATDRRRLRDLLKSLNVPDGMGVIMRTAGMERNKSEIKRDFDYLMRVWEDVRELTLKSAAPALVYKEGDLIKRAIRDLYSREVEEILVEGPEAYQTAKKFMRMMMPSHAKRVQPYRDEMIPLFHRFQVESLLEAMYSPVVHLKSGGYIVINTTEALVAIDVNSGRSTKERNIEETALKTNLEAASEIARQLRLRDLAGLIVIDFIDMDESRNQRAVEKRFKEAVKTDRARIQLGRISTFGLLELSRQRMRPSIIETSSDVCPHCEGTGHVRSIESMAVRALRVIEEEGIRARSSEVAITVPVQVALYILNQKRAALNVIEARYGFTVRVQGDESASPSEVKLDRVRARQTEDETAETAETEETVAVADEGAKKAPDRKRRPRRRGKKEAAGAPQEDEAERTSAEDADDDAPAEGADEASEDEVRADDGEDKKPRRRRRGRRGGRRRSQKKADGSEEPTEGAAEATDEELAEAADAGGDGRRGGRRRSQKKADGAEEAADADGDDAQEAPEHAEAAPAEIAEPAAESPEIEAGAAAADEAPEQEPEPDPMPEEPVDAYSVVAPSEEAASPTDTDTAEPPSDGGETLSETAEEERSAAEGEPEPEPAEDTAPEQEPATEARPTRRGWWQRSAE